MRLGLTLGALLVSASGALAQETALPRPPAPRLTAIVISGGLRRAIFTDPDGQGAATVAEGERFGGFTVAAIRPDAAEVVGTSGTFTVHPSPNARLRSQWATRAPLIDPVRREAETENDQ